MAVMLMHLGRLQPRPYPTLHQLLAMTKTRSETTLETTVPTDNSRVSCPSLKEVPALRCSAANHRPLAIGLCRRSTGKLRSRLKAKLKSTIGTTLEVDIGAGVVGTNSNSRSCKKTHHQLKPLPQVQKLSTLTQLQSRRRNLPTSTESKIRRTSIDTT